MRSDPPVRSVNPFPKHDRIDEVMVALSGLALLFAPIVVINYGGRALIYWLVGILVVNAIQIIVWRIVKHLRGDRQDEMA